MSVIARPFIDKIGSHVISDIKFILLSSLLIIIIKSVKYHRKFKDKRILYQKTMR